MKEQDTTQYNKLPVNSVSPRFAKKDDTPKQGDSGSEEEIDLKSSSEEEIDLKSTWQAAALRSDQP